MDIKKFLHDNGLKQIDLVNYLKISKPFASQLVHGKANLSVPNLNKLISNPYGWDTSALAAPTITARASGNSNATVHIGSGEDVSALRKEIEMLREQLAEEKARSAQYWSMIVNGEIVKTQYKTHEVVRIPISDNAAKFLPKREKGLVFNLPERYYYPFDQWIKTTGIKKHITFHCARHTFACLLLSYGTDIYTTSKLLGHTSVKTTEIYAHIVDEKKRAAVDNIPKL